MIPLCSINTPPKAVSHPGYLNPRSRFQAASFESEDLIGNRYRTGLFHHSNLRFSSGYDEYQKMLWEKYPWFSSACDKYDTGFLTKYPLVGHRNTGCINAFMTLAKVLHLGKLDPSKIKTICDFGAGEGGATLTLKHLFPKSDITALEMNPGIAKTIGRDGILPNEKVIIGDGFQYLSSCEKTENKFDFILASAFFPDGNWFLDINPQMNQLLCAARKALRENGKLMIYSNTGPMNAVKEFLDTHHYQYDWIPSDDLVSQNIIILNKQAIGEHTPSI